MPQPFARTGRLPLLALVTFLLMMPETLPVPVLRGLVLERFGLTDGTASLFMSANMLGALIAAPLAGLWVDRSGRRRNLCIGALCADALLMQALAHCRDFSTFLLLRCLEGAAHIIALLLLMSLVADTAAAMRGRAMGWLGAGLTLGVATGAAVGGIIGRDQPVLTLHTASVLLLVAAAAAVVLLPTDTQPGSHPGIGVVFRAFRTEPRVRLPLLLAFVDRFTVGFFTAGFPLLMAGVHHVDGPHIGMLLAAFLFPFGLLSYPCGRLAERYSRRRLVCGGSLLYGVGVAMVGIVPPAGLWALMPVLGLGSAMMFVPTLLWLLDRAPGTSRSTAMASFHAAGSLGFLLGPIACGWLLTFGATPASGYAIAFGTAGLLEIAGAGLVMLSRSTR